MTKIYKKILPNNFLSQFIDSYWIQKNDVNAALNYFEPTRVLPTNSIEISFYFDDPFFEVKNSLESKLPSVSITGQKTKFKEYRASGKTNVFIIRFKQYGAAPFFNMPVYELLNKNVDVKQLLPNSVVSEIEEELFNSKSYEHSVEVVETLLTKFFNEKHVDHIIMDSVSVIHNTRGKLKVTEIAKKYGISTRHFERRFKSIVGLSPKSFSRNVRLQNVIALKKKGRNWDDLIMESQYYDRSHLIKDFIDISGMSPQAFFKDHNQTELADKFNSDKFLSGFYNTIYV